MDSNLNKVKDILKKWQKMSKIIKVTESIDITSCGMDCWEIDVPFVIDDYEIACKRLFENKVFDIDFKQNLENELLRNLEEIGECEPLTNYGIKFVKSDVKLHILD